MKSSLLALILAAAVPLAAAPAWADSAADAKAHFKRGAELYKSAQYKEAIAEFQAAYQIRPAGVLHYNIAQCFEKMGDIPSALRSYHNYLRETPNADDRGSVEAAISHLEARLAETGVQQVLVYSDPGEAAVTIDGKPAGTTPTAVQLPPGQHTVVVTMDGYATAQQSPTVARDKSLELSFSLQKGAAAPLVIAADNTPATAASGGTSPTPAAGGLTTSKDAPKAQEGGGHVWAWVASGTAVAALATGIALGLGAQSNQATLVNGTIRDGHGNQGWANRATSEALGANVSYGVAGVAAVAAVSLFFLEGKF
jgi:hypothetical protein